MNRNLKTILAGLILSVGLGVGSYLYVPPIRSISNLIYNTTPAPIVETESETKKQEKLPREDAYPVIMSRLKNSSLVYERLQGRFPPEAERDSVTNPDDLPFYSKREEFLKYNKNGVPISVTFSDLNTGDGMHLAYSEAFTPGAYVLLASEGDVCAPPSDEKDEAWRKLAEQFEQEGFVDKSLIDIIMRASTPDCTYFVDKYDSEQARQQRAHERYVESHAQILSGLESVILAYDSLQGSFPYEAFSISTDERIANLEFYKSREVFLKLNESGKPHSVVFSDPNKNVHYQLAFAEPFISSDVFMFISGNSDFCTAPDEVKVRAWQKLIDDFEHGKTVDMSFVYQIIKDDPVPCSSGEAFNKPQTIK